MGSSYSLAQLIIANVIGALVAICITIAATVRFMRYKFASKSTPNKCRKATNLPPVISNSDLETATMEVFLSDISKQSPIRFGAEHLRDFTRNFSTRLGSGSFGVVYKGVFPSGIHIAVKCLKPSLGTRSVADQFMAEVSSIGRTNHVNLVRLYGFCFDPSLQALVYEYLENGSLDSLLFTNKKNKVLGSTPLHQLLKIALGTAKGIAYLHEGCDPRIVHYDIKPGNVLLDLNLTPKVADFGLARLSSPRDIAVETEMEVSGMKGTPGYAAPEVWTSNPVTSKCDVYSFGMLLFEILGRRRNYVESGSRREWLPGWVYEKVEKEEVEEMLSGFGVKGEVGERVERAAKVGLWCVQYLPTARPRMSEVVKMLEGGVEIPIPPNPFMHLVSDDDGSGGGFGLSSLRSQRVYSNTTMSLTLLRE